MAGLYIHIPYCKRKCAYCDFVSVPTENGVPEAYFHALKKEIQKIGASFRNICIDTLFIGGGTPSLLSPKQLEELVAILTKTFSLGSGIEFTVECNPGTIDKIKLKDYKTLGVNRLSIGLQSANDKLLKTIGRIHDFHDFMNAIEVVHRVDIKNFNVDIMYGLPEQTEEDLIDTIDKVAQTGATHISAYSLILEENTPLYQRVKIGTDKLPNEDKVADMEDQARDFIQSLGYSRYEISNYAKEGFRCRHNLNYWENGEYIGLGPAAHSAYHTREGWARWNNTSNINEYIKKCTEGIKPISSMELINPKEEMFETIMLGLRMVEGISLLSFENRYGESLLTHYKTAIEKLRSNGWLDETALSTGRLSLSQKGLDLQNSALMLFMD